VGFEKACGRLGLPLTADAMTESVDEGHHRPGGARGDGCRTSLPRAPWRISARPIEAPAGARR
jgi:hypothetical protein